MGEKRGATWVNSYGYTHYQKNKSYYIKKARLGKIEKARYVENIKKKSKCKDCGIADFRTLEFDHLPEFEKFMEIASMAKLGYSFKKIDDEIAKCDIVCANCHRIRTYDRRHAPVA